MNRHPALTRRAFLKLLGAGAALTLGGDLIRAQGQVLAIPPSLMLHSRHRWRLPAMVEYLAEAGYTGITYQEFERALLEEITLPTRPILITIDDLSPFQGNPSFEYFSAMKDTLVEAGFKGTFAIITRPDQTPNEFYWAAVRNWMDEGITFENHTSYHSNLDRGDFRERDYTAEIIDSTHFLQDRLGIPIRALVTPYGSGFNRQTQAIHPAVTAACETAGLRFVVGIVDGRQPIATPIAADALLYVGRVGPGLSDNAEGMRYELDYWEASFSD